VADVTGALDFTTVLSILAKAGTYLASLLAAGSVLFVLLIARDGWLRGITGRIALVAALAALTLTALRIGLNASFLGGSAGAAFDPLLLSIVLESPLGTSSLVRVAGLALLVFVFLPGLVGTMLAGAGAILVAASFAFVGHTLGEPRVVLGILLGAHALGVAFWIGAFAPLFAVARRAPPLEAGEVAHHFGKLALWAVGGLVAAGMILTVLLVGDPNALARSAYGQLLLVKLMVVAGLMALATLNKERLTPALLEGRPDAASTLRRSIVLEAAAVLAILLLTATFTSLTSPPSRAEAAAARSVTSGFTHQRGAEKLLAGRRDTI
jgi:putative copper resistance protein D